MSDIKSAYKSVALAVWQSLVQQYPDEVLEEDSDDLETRNKGIHADSSSQNITQQQAVENPVSSEQD